MKRCPKCKNDFPDDANFCPVDAGHLIPIEAGSEGAPVAVATEDTGGHELLAGRFALGDIIGGHRTGPVYQARDKEGSTAIVKVVDASVFPTSLLKQRTERELAQLENLKHENVAKILGHGRRGDAIWMATERVDGLTLKAFIEAEGKLSQSRSLKILRQIGSALEAAAKLGVTHRDLSPKNILIAPDDVVKLINFGVPVPGAESKPELQGVAEFIAPEQFEGRPVDQRSNIFSLGAIAHLLLVGQPPFSGSLDEIQAAHGEELRSLAEADGVSAELRNVILKSLEKASSKRFMTLRQFLGGLEAVDSTAAETAPVGKKSSKANPARTLMGLSPIAAPDAAGTPPPASDAPEAGGTADHPAAVLRQAAETPATDSAATTLDHRAPEMTPELIAAAQASAQAAAPVQAAAPAAVAPVATPAPMAESTAPNAAQDVAAPAVAPGIAMPSPAAVASAASAPSGKGAGKKKTVKKASSSNKGKFRETMWFKKGELDEAAAKAAAQAKPEDQVSSKADEMEMDERYKDDGSITQTDKERLSLRTGATMMLEAIPEQAKTTDLVSEADLVSEMTAGRNKIIGGIAVLFIAIGVVVTLLVI
ncbi:MAG: protein kinase [Kofleriaceae bacterium]|nr:protein kinase [Kofleriaceae bacterium]